ncbi:MAG: ribosome maturation factor RimP [Oscillospiraceae bacterium]|nr:ribosome maturation factor RimP [Oscillospiraceae bacterium]MDD4413279.1 ribosome maturation factor RimP [Oscillospiraceae bacterium]
MASNNKSSSNPGNAAAVCFKLAQPVADRLGLLLWDVRFVREGPTWYLRIYIDKEDDDVSIDDCVDMSHRMDKILDAADPISQSYCLEVCSPGIERELTRPEHFARYEGQQVAVRLFSPVGGMREFEGILLGYDDTGITIETDDGNQRHFTKKETSAVRLIAEWDEDEYGGETENE